MTGSKAASSTSTTARNLPQRPRVFAFGCELEIRGKNLKPDLFLASWPHSAGPTFFTLVPSEASCIRCKMGAVNIPKEVADVIDSRAAHVLVDSTPVMNGITRRAAEQQVRTGISGSAAHGIYVGAYFEYFKQAVGELFTTALKIAEPVTGWESSDLLAYVDATVGPFQSSLEQSISRISCAPFSQDEPNLAAVYAHLRRGLQIELSLIRARQRANRSVPSPITIQNSSNFQVGDHNTQRPFP